MTYPIPAPALDDRLGWVGTAGSGKTYNAGVGVEKLLASGSRVVVPDPLGVWWGLGLREDGATAATWREKGKLVIFGGEHGDLALSEHHGALIGETVAGMAESAILDLSGIGTKNGERRFMLAFLTAFYRHSNGEPVHLVFDEADMWAPQQLRDKEAEAAKLLGMMETVVRRGRIKGFIPWLISQRPAVINKDVLSQVDGLIAFKLTSTQDRDALDSWIEGQAEKARGKAIKDSLPTLPIGTGVVWLPGRGVLETATFPAKTTFDSSRTPKRGERQQRRDLKPLNLEKLQERLASVEAEAKANDPRALRVRVGQLERELAAAQKGSAPAWPDQREEVRRLRAELEQLLTATCPIFDRIIEAADQAQRDYLNLLERHPIAIPAAPDGGGDPAQPPGREAPRKPERSAPTARPAPAQLGLTAGEHGTPSPITGRHQKILNAIAWWQAFGLERPSADQVGFIAGYVPSSGNFKNLRGGLHSAGLIHYPEPGTLALTDVGERQAEIPRIEITQSGFHDAVRAKLEPRQLRLLDPVLAAYPGSLSTNELAEAAEYVADSGNFKNLRGSLRTLGLITYPSSGQVRAADWLFP